MASPTSPSNPTTSEDAPTDGTSRIPNSDLGDGPKLRYSPTELARLREQWKYSLIAKVLGKKLQLQYYRDHLLRLWSAEGSLKIIELGCEFFVLKFSEFLDYEKVRKGVPWLIHGYYIAIRPWSENFKPSEATITHTWVWARLPELPIEYYDKEVLFEIGEAIGRPIKIDPITERQEKGRFARICIEVDLRRPLIAHVDLAGLQQKIEYEGHVGQLQQLPLPQSSQAPSHRANSGSKSGLRARGLEQVNPLFPATVLKEPRGKSAITSVSITSPCVEMNLESNKLLGKKRHLQPGEGTSSYVRAEDVPLAVGKLPSPMETPTGHLPPSLEPKMSSKLSAKSAKLPQDSLQQPQNHQAYPLLPSPTESCSNIVASPVTNNPRPTKGLVVSPPQKGSCFPTSSTSKASLNLDHIVTSSVTNNPRPTQGLVVSPPQKASCFPTSSTSKASPNLNCIVASPVSNTQRPTEGLVVFPEQKASCFPTSSTSKASSNLDHIVTSSVTNNPRPTQGLVASPLQKASCFPTSFPAAINASKQTASPQPSPMPNFNFHSLEIKDFSDPEDAERKRGEEMELSSENHPNDFSIQRTPRVFRTEPNTPNFGIRVNFSRTAHQHKIRFIQPETSSTMHHTWATIPASYPKKVLVWNHAEAGNLNFVPAMKELIQMHKPSIILLLEPRIFGADANQVIKDIGFSGSHLLVPDGLAHGIWILWKGEDVHVEVSSSTSAHVHIAVEVIAKAQNRMLYGDTCAQPWGSAGYFYNPNEPRYSSSPESEFSLSENEVRHRIPAPLLDFLFERQKMGATM